MKKQIIFQFFIVIMIFSLIIVSVYELVIIPSRTSLKASEVATVAPTILLNGVVLEHSGVVRKNDKLYITASFIRDVLGASFESAEEKKEQHVRVEFEEGIYYSNKIGVLMYHAVMEEKSDSGISAHQFREHLQWLKDEGFNPISIEQYVEFIHEAGDVPHNAVLITFDDGYENFYTYAYPLLKEFNYPAVNFIIVSGADDRTSSGIKKLTWEQMREMKQYNIAFHNHTYNLHAYGEINSDGIKQPVAISNLYLAEENRVETDEEYMARVTEDLKKAEQRLEEELGNNIRAVSFPYGAYNERLLSILEQLEIKTAFSTNDGLNTSDHVVGNRINAGVSDETADAIFTELKQMQHDTEGKIMLLNDKAVMFKDTIEATGIQHAYYSLREVSTELGIFVGWDAASKTVTIVQ